MSQREPERRESPLDDETPGSQGEVDPGSEGDFTGPPAEPADRGSDERRDPGPTAEDMPTG